MPKDATSRQVYSVGHSVAMVAKKLYRELPPHRKSQSLGNFVRKQAENDKYAREIRQRAISVEGETAFFTAVEDAIRGQYEPYKFDPELLYKGAKHK